MRKNIWEKFFSVGVYEYLSIFGNILCSFFNYSRTQELKNSRTQKHKNSRTQLLKIQCHEKPPLHIFRRWIGKCFALFDFQLYTEALEHQYLSDGNFCGQFDRVFFNWDSHFLFYESRSLFKVSVDYGVLWRIHHLFDFFCRKLLFMAKW